jgi:hypothetical protein
MGRETAKSPPLRILGFSRLSQGCLYKLAGIKLALHDYQGSLDFAGGYRGKRVRIGRAENVKNSIRRCISGICYACVSQRGGRRRIKSIPEAEKVVQIALDYGYKFDAKGRKEFAEALVGYCTAMLSIIPTNTPNEQNGWKTR